MSIQFSFSDKRFLVIGASTGIGHAVVDLLLQSRAQVIAASRNVASSTWAYESGLTRCTLDVTASPSIPDFVKSLGQVDGMVYCAGISMLAPIRLASMEHYQSQMNINFMGAVDMSRNLLKNKSIRTNGSMVFISSISANIGVHGVAAYSASKAALCSFVRVAALEAARSKIRVNALNPGLVRTPLLDAAANTTGGLEDTFAKYPLGIGEPSDVANACAFLLSEESRWITGQSLILDGGHTIGSAN